MTTIRRAPFALMALLVAALLALGPGLRPVPVAQARDISGNTYTSPQFGYSITWDNTWLVMGETSEELDILELTNGFSNVALFGVPGLGSGQLAATLAASGIASQEGISNFVILESGGEESRYWVSVSFTYTFDDGGSINLQEYIEGRTLTPGESTLIFRGNGPVDTFSIARPAFDALLGSIVIPQPEVSLFEGEPGPVFMAGPWRIAIVAAAQNSDLPGIGLDEKDGKEWVAVVADVTNWGSSNPAFPVEDLFVQMAESSTEHSVAAGSTARAVRELELTGNDPIEIEQGATGRVVFVFSVSAGRTEPTLIYRNDRLPLDDLLLRDLEAGDLSEPAGPPEMQEGTLDSNPGDGETLLVQYEGESRTHRIRLLGVDTAGEPDAANELLEAYEGETVWIETDPAFEESGTPSVYLWIENEHGDMVQLNQLLIEEGAAEHSPLPDDARFALWLQVTADQAEAER